MDEGGEIVFRSGGTWIVDSTMGTGGISPRSGTRIVIEDGAVLKVMPNGNDTGRLIDIGRDGPVSNVTIEGGGTLLGDVLTHTGSTGEWGHLVHITNGSSNIEVVGPIRLKQAWGDGLYIGDGTRINRDVLIDGVVVDDCRREGIAPFFVDGCTVRNCRVENTSMTASAPGGPSSGIDCEPNDGQRVANLTIENCHIENCDGPGIYISANPGPIENLIVRNNTVVRCGKATEKRNTYMWNGVHVAVVDRPLLTGNVVVSSGYDGDPSGVHGQIYLRDCINPVLAGGSVRSGRGRGIFVTHCRAPEVRDVSIQDNDFEGIVVFKSDGAQIHNNDLLDNAQSSSSIIDHLSIKATGDARVDTNRFQGSQGGSWIRIGSGSSDVSIMKNEGLGTPPHRVVIDDGARTEFIDGGIGQL